MKLAPALRRSCLGRNGAGADPQQSAASLLLLVLCGWSLLHFPCMLLPGALAQQGVLLNTTEQLDPLVEMNLAKVPTPAPRPYNCHDINDTFQKNGEWTAECDLNRVNVTSLTITKLATVNTIPDVISNLFALTSLTMSGIGLRYSLPSTLGFLGFLRELNLSQNQLNGTFPGTLCILTNLSSLDLNSNDLSATINTALGTLTTLEHLDLGRNYFSGSVLPSLVNLTQLSYLDISAYPNLTASPISSRSIASSRNLRELRGASFSSLLQSVAPVYHVFSDDVSKTNISSLTSLQYLNLSNANITGNISDLAALTRLAILDVRNTSIAGYYPKSFYNVNITILANNASQFCPTENHCNATTGNSTWICQNVCTNICYCPYEFPLWAIIVIVIGVAMLIMIVLIAVYVILRHKTFNDGVEVHGVRRFSVPELEVATVGFSKILGKGGFGEVYKGTVLMEDNSEKEVAVKKTKPLLERKKNMKKFDSGFRNEIMVLSGVRHRNLVELIGYSSKGADVLLVYEFITQGSLDDLLKREINEEGIGDASLTWERRLKVAFGAAQGLDYLHSGVNPPIIHRDIKSSNILVDADYVAKVADFGLSKIRPELELDGNRTGVQGTLGYIDPEYAATLKPTERSDVYSFGVVLLELATGWRPIGGQDNNKHIIQRVAKGVNSSGFEAIVAPSIKKELEDAKYYSEGDARPVTTAVLYTGSGTGDEAQGAEVTIAPFSDELFQRFVKLGMQCCAKDSSTRPSMRGVAKALGEMIEGKLEESTELTFDEEGADVVMLSHNLGGAGDATVAFVMESQAGPR